MQFFNRIREQEWREEYGVKTSLLLCGINRPASYCSRCMYRLQENVNIVRKKERRGYVRPYRRVTSGLILGFDYIDRWISNTICTCDLTEYITSLCPTIYRVFSAFGCLTYCNAM